MLKKFIRSDLVAVGLRGLVGGREQGPAVGPRRHLDVAIVTELADVEELVVEEHEEDAGDEQADDRDDDRLPLRLFKV